MQKPMPSNFIGLPVAISVLDSNCNFRQIGIATTDTSGTYSLSWTPDIPGDYTVYANFAGTSSYWGSTAEAHFVAGSPAPIPTSTMQTVSLPPITTYFAASTIVIVIAIAIVGVLILKKKP